MYAQHPDFVNMIDCTSTNSWVVENYQVHEPALAAVCRKCNVAGVSPDETLRSKCISAGVPAAPGTGRPEDFDRTASSAPSGDSSGGGSGLSFTTFFLGFMGLMLVLGCMLVLTVASRSSVKSTGQQEHRQMQTQGDPGETASAPQPSAMRGASGSAQGALSEPINV